jgi:hypothetical protein
MTQKMIAKGKKDTRNMRYITRDINKFDQVDFASVEEIGLRRGVAEDICLSTRTIARRGWLAISIWLQKKKPHMSESSCLGLTLIVFLSLIACVSHFFGSIGVAGCL